MEWLSMGWVPVVLAGASLLVSAITLLVAMRILDAARRSERAGDERLEILREQRQRLDQLDDERRVLLDTLELLRRQVDDGSKHRPETPPAPPEEAAEEAVPEPSEE